MFRGIPKREEILLRSFLNLVDSDFDCRVEADGGDYDADVVVLDESVLKDVLPDAGDDISYIVLGSNGPYPDMAYVSRPLHWSAFTRVFEEAISSVVAPEQSPTETESQADKRSDMDEFIDGPAAPDTDTEVGVEKTTDQTVPIELEIPPSELEMPEMPHENESEQDTVPADLSSLEVVGGEPGESVLPPGVLSRNDADSTRAEGVAGAAGTKPEGSEETGNTIDLKLSENDDEILPVRGAGKAIEDTVIIETDFIDAWTISIEAELNSVSQSLNEMKRGPLAREPVQKIQPVPRQGVRVPSGIRFWEGDAEILLGGAPLFLIDETGQRLYSDSPIREWTKILRERNLIRRDLSEGWYVDPSVKSSPLPWFLWCSAQARSKGRLLSKIDPGQEYLLEKWPNFELIRNDNQSLRLCALLFSRPESVKSLVAKSEIKGRKVVAFMNACYLLGLIKMTGIDEELQWTDGSEVRPLTLMQRLRRTWGI